MIRENVYGAVLTALQGLTASPYSLSIPTISRGFQHWSDVPPASCPALFLVPVTENAKFVRGQPIKWMVTSEVWVYVKQDSSALGVQVLNPILDGIESVLAPPSNTPYANTLNGTVFSCSISGNVQIHGGFIAGTTVAVVPIEIIVTP